MAICCAFTILLTSFSSIYAYFVNEDLTYSLGVAFCTYYAVNFAFWLSKAIFVYNFLPAQNFRKKYGEWAIVTGCTDGIGRAYALELANKYKMKIILLSRTQSKLEELQKEIPTETKILAVDFSSTDNQIYEQIKNLISGLDIGVLINNVGAGYNHSDYFTQIETSDIDRLISINCFPQVKMSHLVIPGMNERKRGLIVSLSSFSGLYPMPLLALYSCCKEFNRYVSESLRRESKYITFQTIQPYFVTTKLAKIRKPSLLIPTPKNFVAAALKTCGYYNVTAGYFTQHLYTGMTQFGLSCPILCDLVEKISFGHNDSVRRRAYKKKERLSKGN